MNINLGKDFRMVTYSKDLIGIKKGNKTIVSYRNIYSALNWIEKNLQKGVKNRVFSMLIDFNNIAINSCKNSLETKHYKVSFDDLREYIITDKVNRNNQRWVYDKRKMIETIYNLEINRLEVYSIDELVSSIKDLNIDIYIVLTRGDLC